MTASPRRAWTRATSAGTPAVAASATLASSQCSRSSLQQRQGRRRRLGGRARRARRRGARSRRQGGIGHVGPHPADELVGLAAGVCRRDQHPVRASTARATSSRRPSLEPKWYRSMRWLVPTASAMRRRLWSASRRRRSARSPRRAALPGAVRPWLPSCTKWYIPRKTRGGSHGQQVIDGRRRRGGPRPCTCSADGSTWPEWSPLGSSRSSSRATACTGGLGAVRLFTTGRITRAASGWSSAGPARSSPTSSRRACPAGLPGRRHADARRRRGHHHQLALDLPGQGARHRLALPAPAGRVHRRTVEGWPRRRTPGGPSR